MTNTVGKPRAYTWAWLPVVVVLALAATSLAMDTRYKESTPGSQCRYKIDPEKHFDEDVSEFMNAYQLTTKDVRCFSKHMLSSQSGKDSFVIKFYGNESRHCYYGSCRTQHACVLVNEGQFIPLRSTIEPHGAFWDKIGSGKGLYARIDPKIKSDAQTTFLRLPWQDQKTVKSINCKPVVDGENGIL